MGVAAKLDPEIVYTYHLAEALCPEKVGPALVQGYDIFVGYLRQYPFLFTPNSRAVRPLGGLVTVLKEFHPCLGVPAGEGVDVVLNSQQRTAGLAAIDNGVKRVFGFALLIDALKPRSV